MAKQPSAIIETLEPEAYIDPQLLVREQQRIFAATWQYAGHIRTLSPRYSLASTVVPAGPVH